MEKPIRIPLLGERRVHEKSPVSYYSAAAAVAIVGDVDEAIKLVRTLGVWCSVTHHSLQQYDPAKKDTSRR